MFVRCTLSWIAISLMFDGVYPQCSPSNSSDASQDVVPCFRGTCVENVCECFPGWMGDKCQHCSGRTLLTNDSGYVTDGPGNYTAGMQCSWIIQPSSASGKIIRLKFLEFASECGWDYLYVYDGDSVYAPLLATFNGLVRVQGLNSLGDYAPEVVATSGSVFIHFFSDMAYFAAGFNISYSMDSCPRNCSGHGTCQESSITCSCETGWSGDACQNPTCPSNCSLSSELGYCFNITGDEICNCDSSENNCSNATSITEGFWTEQKVNPTSLNTARSSHGVVLYEDSLWVFGGIQFNDLSNKADLMKLDLGSNEWEVISPSSSDAPTARYGHSLVLFGKKLILFGGKDLVTNRTMDELWEFNLASKMWTKISYITNFPTDNSTVSPLALWGHTGTVVELDHGNDLMIVMFGFHPLMEYSGFVYEYNITAQEWSIAITSGATIEASYGHSAVWDPVNKGIYLHGGICYKSASSYVINDTTFFYDPANRSFKRLKSSGVPRKLHSSVLLDGVIFIYGGCTHNDTSSSTGALCFSPSFMTYHIACDMWDTLPSPNNTSQPSRYGHSATSVKSSHGSRMIIYGGYDSIILDSVIVFFRISVCSAFGNNASNCTGVHRAGISCIWNGTDCIPALRLNQTDSSCSAASENSPESNGSMANIETAEYCERFRTCSQCSLNEICQWKAKECVNRTDNTTSNCREVSCGSITSCSDCTNAGKCMWCTNKQVCISTTSYIVHFPYGECMEWINKLDECSSKAGCHSHTTCKNCRADPFCGWCDDGSNTGLGSCQNGAESGPFLNNNTTSNVISPSGAPRTGNSTCPSSSWFFTNCPLCQCNGHSQCSNQTSQCKDCQDKTQGEQCERCIDGYFGDATNGGTCETCQCYGRASLCNNTTGNCFCSTKGAKGDKCEECNSNAKYFGDPKNNGTCFYRLLINYSFTFSLTVEPDRYVTNINFENTPPADDNAKLTLEAEKACTVRLAIFYREKVPSLLGNSSTESDEYRENEINITQFTNIKNLLYDFSSSQYDFGNTRTNATIRVYVSNFTVPMKIQISLVQTSNRLLILLLILFSCFLVLLLLTALVWKLKMIYDTYQRRRQQAVQLEQMAARPFATVQLCLDDITKSKKLIPVVNDLATVVDAVAEEKHVDGTVSAISVIFWMPSGNLDEESTWLHDENKSLNSISDGSPDNCSLAIGTALIPSANKQQAEQILPPPSSSLLSRTDKLKVVFKRARRQRPNDSREHQQCGHSMNHSNNSSNVESSNDGLSRNSSVHYRHSKRGRSSFASIRSVPRSPSAREDITATSPGSENQDLHQSKLHPMVLARNAPNEDKVEVTV